MADPTLNPNQCQVIALEDIPPGFVVFTQPASLTVWFARALVEGEIPSGVAEEFIAKGEVGKVTVRGWIQFTPPDLPSDVFYKGGES